MLPIGDYYRWAVTSLCISVNNISSAVLMYLQYREKQYRTVAFISMFCSSLREGLLYGFRSGQPKKMIGFFLFSFLLEKDLSQKYPEKTVVCRQKYMWVPALPQEGWLKERYLGFFEWWVVIIVMFSSQNCMQEGGYLHKIALNEILFFFPPIVFLSAIW